MEQKHYPSISVIMPVRNEEKYLVAAIESIRLQNYPGELEILVAVAPSLDSTAEVAKKLARQYPELKVLENKAGLTTTGLNTAIKLSRGEVIVRVDAHCELGENYLVRGVEVLQSSGAAVVGGIMQALGKTPVQRAVAFAYGSRFGLGGGSYHLGGQEGEAESAYLGIFDAKRLRAVNGYDERIIRGEDWDLSQRLKANGGKVWFNPTLIVNYWPRSNLRALAWQFYSTGVWRGDLTRRSPAKASLRYFVPPMLVLSLIGSLVILSLGSTLGILPFAAYCALLLFAIVSAKSLSLIERLSLLIVLPTMHLSWGLGFWFGLIFGAGKTIDSGSKR